MFLPPSEWLIFSYYNPIIGNIRNTLCISLLAMGICNDRSLAVIAYSLKKNNLTVSLLLRWYYFLMSFSHLERIGNIHYVLK